jgi:hypothetical protein
MFGNHLYVTYHSATGSQHSDDEIRRDEELAVMREALTAAGINVVTLADRLEVTAA